MVLDALDRTRPDQGGDTQTPASFAHAVRNAQPAAVTHVVQAGETLGALAARYNVPLATLAGANPSLHDPNLIRPGQVLTIPGGHSEPPPQQHTIHPGETLGAIAASTHTTAARLAAANGIADPNRIRAGQTIWLPGTPPAQPASGAPAAKSPNLAPANHPSATPAPAAHAAVAAPAAHPASPPQPSAASQASAIATSAAAEPDPAKSLQHLNQAYAKAPYDVQHALLEDPAAAKILDATAATANQPLTEKPANGIFPQAQTLAALTRLDRATQGLDPALAGAIADRAAPAYAAFQKAPDHGAAGLVGSQGMTTLMSLSARIAGTPQGDAAVAQFAATGAWNGDSVRNAIAAGTDPAYAIALGRQITAAHQGGGIVAQTITDGLQGQPRQAIAAGADPTPLLHIADRMRAAGLDASGVPKIAIDGTTQFKDRVASDVKSLAQHDSELAWLVKNDGAALSPQQLNQAVTAYRNSQGPAWQKQDAALRQQVTADGSKLLHQMAALNQSPTASADSGQALRAIANDPAAGLAISSAIQSDPSLVAAGQVHATANLFVLSKVGDIGRKFTNELAAAYVRQNVMSKLQGVDLHDPASVAQAKTAIGGLASEDFARLIGVSPSDTKKAVDALQDAVDHAGTTPEEADAALGRLNDRLDKNAALAKAFNKTTVPGQLLRGVGVAFAGASLLNTGNKFAANPSDPQNGIALLVNAAGFAQKNTELLVGLGKIGKDTPLGQFGGEWKLAGRAGAGDLLAGVSAVLDGVSAVRSGFGIGEKQDTASAAFSATTSVGGLMAVAPAFGAAAWLGPVGLGVVAVGVVGNAVYQDVKNAHHYEGASHAFLQAAGYSPQAARALSAQDGILSGATGAGQMPFLAKYAAMKHLTPDQLQAWVNRMSPDQVSTLSKCLLQTAGDAHGGPARFTAGPPQSATIVSEFPVQITLTNTLGVFENNLRRDHVPLP